VWKFILSYNRSLKVSETDFNYIIIVHHMYNNNKMWLYYRSTNVWSRILIICYYFDV